jgi:hypothetical protein
VRAAAGSGAVQALGLWTRTFRIGTLTAIARGELRLLRPLATVASRGTRHAQDRGALAARCNEPL